MLGASGQEELAKRLAELELSRELLDDIGDDQDWFEEDFGLKSRREQQRRQQRQREEEEEDEEENRVGGGRPEQQAKTPPRPELPLPLLPKLPEQPAMVVPHSATEVERLVHAATTEIWDTCSLGRADVLTLAGLAVPRPSLEYLGKEANGQDPEDLCIRSYRQVSHAVRSHSIREQCGVWLRITTSTRPHFHIHPCSLVFVSVCRVFTTSPGRFSKRSLAKTPMPISHCGSSHAGSTPPAPTGSGCRGTSPRSRYGVRCLS